MFVRINVTLRHVRVALVDVENQRVCIPAVFIRHELASFLRRIILSSVACMALSYFSTLSHRRHDFQGGGGGGY
jgi:hypothetical protein